MKDVCVWGGRMLFKSAPGKRQSKMESAHVREGRHSPIRGEVSEDIRSFGLLMLLIHSTAIKP